ncbi:MAG: twin-arginine translocation signal domain-containing protein [Candidatus Aenigmarchaeota archaeon]|nr:twin-arginine translocation signal domain-containing protein [Candidatus Aenigmarchaeota archaeon]
MAKRLTKKQISRRQFLKGFGMGTAAGIVGTLGVQYGACREEKLEEIAGFKIPFDNWLTVVGAKLDDVYMSRCGNFDLGAALLYLEDQEDVNHPRMDYEEKNKLIEREEKVGIHREEPQMTKGGKRGYNLRVVGLPAKKTEEYINKVIGRRVKISSKKTEKFAASPVVNVEDLGPGLYRDAVITANVDIIDMNPLSEADMYR